MSYEQACSALGVQPDATAEAKKKAYKELALSHHPDKKSGSKEDFQRIAEAYEVASQPRPPQRQQERPSTRSSSKFDPSLCIYQRQ